MPTFGAGVYTIWHQDGRFLYVGMSGRSMTADTVHRRKPLGIYTRLKSHASGRRSGDQFCVYVADRLVLPTLSQEDIREIASGQRQMDAFVRKYIHHNLSYRFVILPDGKAARDLEAAIQGGKWGLVDRFSTQENDRSPAGGSEPKDGPSNESTAAWAG